MATATTQWDVFISYASEDRESVALPLATELARRGVRVWLDKFELRVGDSLRERIDEGLAHSRFGIVVLSPNFFNKHYPTRELNGLAQQEISGDKVILPIWKDVTAQDVRSFSPPLADRIAITWQDNLASVVGELLPIIRPDIVEKAKLEALTPVQLPIISSGRQLMQVIERADMLNQSHEEFETAAELEQIAPLMDEIRELVDTFEFLEAGDVPRTEFSFTEKLRSLTAIGWKLHGGQHQRMVTIGEKPLKMKVGALAFVRLSCESVAVQGEKFFLYKPEVPSRSL
ncbi:hypothetical protein GCM10023172_35720 [Hymenobacter ginsengisoli]|uniref:TIR domain-containing protein n=1 Tax=Hymenobacter ginsengisoli TaxID=1051626 RepID=A0ABP8QPC8_9BACT|nr:MULTISPECIES: toll/interleukin-1 receptor domain-containing protein [unclassified Hymenobacter]MBO2033880.1 toll/interleukin-1 receptor domain-containing protein [Hymenobacter sp. BT559]